MTRTQKTSLLILCIISFLLVFFLWHSQQIPPEFKNIPVYPCKIAEKVSHDNSAWVIFQTDDEYAVIKFYTDELLKRGWIMRVPTEEQVEQGFTNWGFMKGDKGILINRVEKGVQIFIGKFL